MIYSEKGALVSQDGRYRYGLFRRWGDDGPGILWVMLNPSTADADQDDPTIRRVVRFSSGWGYAHCTVVNLFAHRATFPRTLRWEHWGGTDIVGPGNDDHIREASLRCAHVIFAWGAHGTYLHRDRAVWGILKNRGPLCLGVTKMGGQPRHPLYVKGDTGTMPWTPPKEDR